MKSKIALLEEMRFMINEMEPALKLAKLNGHLKVPMDSIKLPIVFIREGHHWLTDITATTLNKFLRVWRLQSVERWERLLEWEDSDDFPETQLLKTVVREFKISVKSQKRANFFKTKEWKRELKKASRAS
jgi:hypothetical protein